MEIIINTDGYTKNTTIKVNGKALDNIEEFDFAMNPHRYGKDGGVLSQGKCKMHQIYRGADFRSYFGGDFRKMDEITNRRNNGKQGSAGDTKGNRSSLK